MEEKEARTGGIEKKCVATFMYSVIDDRFPGLPIYDNDYTWNDPLLKHQIMLFG